MRRFVLVLLMLVSTGLSAQVKVGGREIVPKGLIFGDADSKSRIVAEDELSDGCSWELQVETRFAEDRDDGDCVLDYRRTTVTLTKKCAAPAQPESSTSERVTVASRPRCPATSGDLPAREIESKAVSFGTIPDGRRQAILSQPDGTRLTLTWSGPKVGTVIRYPDGTSDTLEVEATPEEKAAEASPKR